MLYRTDLCTMLVFHEKFNTFKKKKINAYIFKQIFCRMHSIYRVSKNILKLIKIALISGSIHFKKKKINHFLSIFANCDPISEKK